MLNSESAAYIAGLFDGEGSVTYKKYKEKKKTGTYDCWRIVMEISMTDYSVLVWVLETLNVGTVRPKKDLKVSRNNGVGVVALEMLTMCVKLFGPMLMLNYQRFNK